MNTDSANDMRVRRSLRPAVKWLAVLLWAGTNAGWMVWRGLREYNWSYGGGRFWPEYHLWFFLVTAVLIGFGIVLASLKRTAGATPWQRFWTIIAVGSVCLTCFCYEIGDMVSHCGLAYPAGW